MIASRQTTEKYYACIDLKCFYASVECVERGLDFFKVNLEAVVKDAPIRKLAVNANKLIWLSSAEQSLFSSYDVDEEKDRDMQQALLDIKGRYGKNSILRGISYREKATGKIRNTLIGGHNGG